jgi:hypothetical protein
MRKIAAVSVLTVLMWGMAVAAWAIERSALVSEQELAMIESVAQKAYPRGVRVDMVVGDDLLGRFAVIDFIAKNEKQNLQFEVNPLKPNVKMSGAGSAEIGERVGIKIAEGIEKILNRSAQEALKR